MKRILPVVLALTLSACSVVVPAQPTPVPPQPTQPPPPTPIVVTVVVEQPVVVTATPMPVMPSPTQEVAPPEPTATPMPVDTPTPEGVSSGIFVNITRSTDRISLRCPPSEVTFNLSVTDTYVTAVEFYYRMEDKVSSEISEWKHAGSMQDLGDGNYTFTFQALDVHPDLRPREGWLDYQFVAVNKYGDVVGRSEKFNRLIVYTIDCPQ